MARKKMCPYCFDDGSGDIPEEHEELFFDEAGEIVGIPIMADIEVGITSKENYLYASVWLAADSEKDTHLITNGRFKEAIVIPINYCPMCGRKL